MAALAWAASNGGSRTCTSPVDLDVLSARADQHHRAEHRVDVRADQRLDPGADHRRDEHAVGGRREPGQRRQQLVRGRRPRRRRW